MSTIQDLIDYVRETPENTNPAVIRTIAQNLEGGSEDAITVTFTVDEEDEWSCDWEFDDLYEKLRENQEKELASAVYMKIDTGEHSYTMRALPVMTDPDIPDPDDYIIELWGDDSVYNVEENAYELSRMKLVPDNIVSFIGTSLIDQSR